LFSFLSLTADSQKLSVACPPDYATGIKETAPDKIGIPSANKDKVPLLMHTDRVGQSLFVCFSQVNKYMTGGGGGYLPGRLR